jgi:FKBP-type peptidyl-prolyl cis-trans isomerase (trigger factor)
MHMEWAAYLSEIGKTEKEMAEELYPDAEKRVKAELILLKIAEEKDLKSDTLKIAEEVALYTKQYPDANKENIQAYFDQIYTNEAVLSYLESL